MPLPSRCSFTTLGMVRRGARCRRRELICPELCSHDLNADVRTRLQHGDGSCVQIGQPNRATWRAVVAQIRSPVGGHEKLPVGCHSSQYLAHFGLFGVV